jgi:hypothetical protein
MSTEPEMRRAGWGTAESRMDAVLTVAVIGEAFRANKGVTVVSRIGEAMEANGVRRVVRRAIRKRYPGMWRAFWLNDCVFDIYHANLTINRPCMGNNITCNYF